MTGRYKAYPEYKESGVEWLGKVPQDWSIHSLKRTVDRVTNGIWGSEPDSENDLIVLRVADFNRNQLNISDDKLTFRSIDPKDRSARLLKKGDLLIEKSGGGDKTLVGCVVLFDKEYPAVTSNFVAKMTPQQGFDSSFLRYAFSKLYAGKVNFPSIKQTTGIQNLDSDAYLLESFAFPSFEEQQKIANFLDHETAKIDTLITKQEKLIELLKEKRQAVISHAVTKGLNPDAPMKDSGVEWLGDVPEHWVVAQLKINTVLMQTGPFGSQLHAEDYVEGGIPLINPAHMIDGKIIPDMKVTVDIETQERLCRHKLSKGDIIFARRGELGRCAIVQSNQVGWLCGTGSLKATLNERLIPEYAYLLITSEGVTAELSLESKGSTMDNLNTETLGKIRTPVPPTQEQLAILDYVNDVSGKYKRLIENAVLAIKLMKERKTALISAAVTGKIDVRDWDAQGVQG
ncbi:restriction endonuclease subunit S [Vibrio parahaemolyticus]|uniref:restriction endonuclease subunit S n=1 Tax=Vibrio TaxID=662 RepID=UPI002360F470|nr:restriction endonuclease subunit S [Vibrio parahaemolyticus]EGQ8123316.1 restriction endonuclease subunit S [Vibrio parahaemolyticus]ELA7846433.1 restriction endonuclease subunit S [Vibrio parahaemolyticus]MDF4687479.1 restriction endonuclease subunit S [Vibrio parahaemolyticus]MDF5516040.1 restriction endonuclease subunit S [Vibrio parahaemolyticus]MDF5521307.1 restriction endonuclease subunit S [Vibrio parahaemolyticus]